MPRYLAQNQSLFGAPGSPNPPTTQIDIGGTIDALTNGATSLIHNVMLKRQAANQMAIEQGNLAIARDREAREAQAQAADLDFRKSAERHRFLEAGGIPEHDETQAVPGGTAPINSLNLSQLAPSPIRAAVTSGAPSVPPVAAPISAVPSATAPSETPISKPAVVTEPESYDPTRAGSYQRGVAMQELRNEGYMTRDEARNNFQREQLQTKLQAQQAGREYMAGAAQTLARLRASLSSAKTSVQKAMTANKMEDARQQAAIGLIDRVGGSYDDASALLNSNTPEGKAFRDLGVDIPHLAYAHSKWTQAATSEAIRLQGGATGMEPSEAAGAVSTTRNLVGGGAATPMAPAAGAGGGTKGAPKSVTPAPAPGARTVGGGNGKPSPKKTITADQRDYLKTVKHLTDAQINQRYVVQP